MKNSALVSAVLLFGLLPWAGARAALPAEQARALGAAHQDSVLVVQGTLAAVDSRSEHRISVAGTVVDAAGLVVISSRLGAEEWKRIEQHLVFVMPDETEVPARLVLSDEDLALAVLAPAPAPGAAPPVFKPVTLARDAQADVYTDVLTLSRLDKEYHFRPAADTGKVIAVTTRPRREYLVDTNPCGPHRLGLPTFLADGRLLGINTIRREASRPARRPGFPAMAAQSPEPHGHLVPADALLELRDQARKVLAAKAPPR